MPLDLDCSLIFLRTVGSGAILSRMKIFELTVIDNRGTRGPAAKRSLQGGRMLLRARRRARRSGWRIKLGVIHNHHASTVDRDDTGHDLPTVGSFTVLFTVDEATFSREIAPLAGFYLSI